MLGQAHSIFWGFNLMYTVLLCDHTADCVAYSSIRDKYRIFNIWARAVHVKRCLKAQASLHDS